jgi:hypothetical protein
VPLDCGALDLEPASWIVVHSTRAAAHARAGGVLSDGREALALGCVPITLAPEAAPGGAAWRNPLWQLPDGATANSTGWFQGWFAGSITGLNVGRVGCCVMVNALTMSLARASTAGGCCSSMGGRHAASPVHVARALCASV